MMPSEIQYQAKSFVGVTQSLKKMVEMPEADASKTTEYSETWDRFSQESESIIASMREIATSDEKYINDRVNAENNSLFREAPDMDAVKNKIGQLVQLEADLRGASGENVQKSTNIAERITKLKRDVASFGSQLKKCPPNTMKKPTDADNQTSQYRSQPTDSNVMGSLNLSERCWGIISSPFGGMHLGGEQEQNRNGDLVNTPARASDRGAQLKKQELQKEWETAISECCDQIDAIVERMNSIKALWLTLSANAQSLLTQLSFLVKRDNLVFFNLSLGNFENQCKEAYAAFHDFTHNEPIGQTVQATSRSLPQPPNSTQKQGWFRRK